MARQPRGKTKVIFALWFDFLIYWCPEFWNFLAQSHWLIGVGRTNCSCCTMSLHLMRKIWQSRETKTFTPAVHALVKLQTNLSLRWLIWSRLTRHMCEVVNQPKSLKPATCICSAPFRTRQIPDHKWKTQNQINPSSHKILAAEEKHKILFSPNGSHFDVPDNMICRAGPPGQRCTVPSTSRRLWAAELMCTGSVRHTRAVAHCTCIPNPQNCLAQFRKQIRRGCWMAERLPRTNNF